MNYLKDYQALLFDLDGTLTNEKREISPETTQMLQKLTQSFTIGVCTGRSYIAIEKMILSHFPSSALHVLSGGARVTNNLGEVFFDKSVPGEITKKIFDDLSKLGAAFIFQSDTYLHASTHIYQNLLKHPWKMPVRDVKEMTNWQVPLFSVYNVNQEITNYLLNTKEISFKTISKVETLDYYDVTAVGVNKSLGLQEWSKQTDISLDKVIGFGDGDNDTEFLEAVGFGVAMPHAPENLKQSADKVLTSEYQNLGVYLEKILESGRL